MKRLKSITRLLSAGFTLAELLVVISIVSLISSVALVNYRRGVAQYSLTQANQRLLADLREIQNRAISGTGISLGYCGYGVQINSSSRPYSYRIYADKNSNCATSNNRYNSSDDIIEEVELTNNIKIRTSSPSPVDIFFKPPEPQTYINQSQSIGEIALITLEAEGYSLPTKTIRVNTSGLIQTD